MFKLVSVLLVIYIAGYFAFSPLGRPGSMLRAQTSLGPKLPNAVDFLTGKATVEADRAFNNMSGVRKPNTKQLRKKPRKPIALSAEGEEAVALFRKTYPKPRPEGKFDLEDWELALQFQFVSKLMQSDDSALKIFKNAPTVFTVSEQRMTEVFDIYVNEKWGFEKARDVCIRNPNLLAVPVRGYGSAEVAGDDAVSMSYIIAFTRPIGTPLLVTLAFLLSYKPLIAGNIIQPFF